MDIRPSLPNNPLSTVRGNNSAVTLTISPHYSTLRAPTHLSAIWLCQRTQQKKIYTVTQFYNSMTSFRNSTCITSVAYIHIIISRKLYCSHFVPYEQRTHTVQSSNSAAQTSAGRSFWSTPSFILSYPDVYLLSIQTSVLCGVAKWRLLYLWELQTSGTQNGGPPGPGIRLARVRKKKCTWTCRYQ